MNIPSHSDVRGFAFGDINQDGRLDFVVSEGAWATVGVYLNHGPSDFALTTTARSNTGA